MNRPFVLKPSKLIYLTILVLVCGCSVGPKEEFENIQAPKDEQTEQVAKPTVSQFLESPFSFDVLNDNRWKVKTKSVSNTHDKKKKDELKVFAYKQSLIKYVNEILIEASILDEDIQLSNGVHVGMSRKEVFSTFSGLKKNNDSPYVNITKKEINIGCCMEQSELWSFKFDNDTLIVIDFTQYYD